MFFLFDNDVICLKSRPLILYTHTQQIQKQIVKYNVKSKYLEEQDPSKHDFMFLRVFLFSLTIGVKHFTGKSHLGWAERVVRGKYKPCGEYTPFKWCPFRAPAM